MTRQRKRTYLTAGLFIAGLISGYLLRVVSPLPPAVYAVWIGVTIALVGWAGMYCWSLLDEAQKEAHKWAWYWGGSIGMIVGFVAMIVAFRFDPNVAEVIQPNGSSRSFVELGYVAGLGSILIGYSIAWAAWWLKRR